MSYEKTKSHAYGDFLYIQATRRLATVVTSEELLYSIVVACGTVLGRRKKHLRNRHVYHEIVQKSRR